MVVTGTDQLYDRLDHPAESSLVWNQIIKDPVAPRYWLKYPQRRRAGDRRVQHAGFDFEDCRDRV